LTNWSEPLFSSDLGGIYVSFVRALKKKVDEGQDEGQDDEEEQEGGN
jgi:hypothetical protein